MSKKLQIGTPIRREHVVTGTNSDWLTGEDGIATENTAALHFNGSTAVLNLQVQGRNGKESEWTTIHIISDSPSTCRVDVSMWEFTRYRAIALNGAYDLIVTAYDPIRFYDNVVVESNNRDLTINQNILNSLDRICLEIQKLNLQMETITENQITLDDISGDK